MKSNQLTPRQERFCSEYLVDLNASKAAERAGCTPVNAPPQGSKWLKNPKVQTRVAELMKARGEEVSFTPADVLREVKVLATSNFGDFLDKDGSIVENLSLLPRDTLAAVESIRETRNVDGTVVRSLKLYSKTRALEIAGRHVNVGAFLERFESVRRSQRR